MAELSIIIPYCNEMPQVAFTVRGLILELENKIDYEIILINNATGESYDQGHGEPDHEELNGPLYFVERIKKGLLPRVKHLDYFEKLSHWNAKRVGMEEATGDIFLFIDAHVLVAKNSILSQFAYYKDNYKALNGSLHLLWSYLNDGSYLDGGDDHRLQYRLVADLPKGIIHYTSKSYEGTGGNDVKPYEVPCMSTCGMMIYRGYMEQIGGWPNELGIYGGGENVVNFVGAILGLRKWIWPRGTFFHHAAPRGYNWNWYDWHRNRMIATYLAGGRRLAKAWANTIAQQVLTNGRGDPRIAEKLFRSVVNEPKLEVQRGYIDNAAITTLGDWAGSWNESHPEFVRWESE